MHRFLAIALKQSTMPTHVGDGSPAIAADQRMNPWPIDRNRG
jgi:hypothetical protein